MKYSLDFEYNQPAADEIEITVLGPGRASGESLVVHLRDGEWLIIDSCMSGDAVLPLAYLNTLHIDPKKVKTVICTHWHTDHILGLPEVLKQCEQAELYIAPVGDFNSTVNSILQIAGLETVDTRIWNVFDECLHALSENQRPRPHYLFHDQPVFTPKDGPMNMHAFGPADELYSRLLEALAKLNPSNPDETQIKNLEGNLCSLALSLTYAGQKVLIGGDMEVGRNDRYNHRKCGSGCATHKQIGWCDVLENSKVYPTHTKYNFVKLPHHSSVTGYCPKMWKNHVEAPIGVTTAFECKKKEVEDLPRKDMLDIYCKLCGHLFITCDNDAGGVKGTTIKHDISASEGVEVLERIEESYGAVVSRWKPGSDGWNIACFGEGSLVNTEYLSNYHCK